MEDVERVVEKGKGGGEAERGGYGESGGEWWRGEDVGRVEEREGYGEGGGEGRMWGGW